MKGRSALLAFTVHIRAVLLHKLLQGVADRAYEIGYNDAKGDKPHDTSKVRIDPFQIRKLQ